MPSDANTAEVLAGVLIDLFRQELDQPGLGFRRPPSPLGGGKFTSLYAFELTESPKGWTESFVARLVEPAQQVRLEVGLQRSARAEGLSAPRVLCWKTSVVELDTGLVVMERRPGRTYLRGVEPWRFALDLPKLVGAWPQRLAQVVAALARVDTDEATKTLERHDVPADMSRPVRHLRTVTRLLADEPSLTGVVEWLHVHHPDPPAGLALVHGDLWPGNVFVRSSGIELIDWTRGGLDDPALDVGFAKVGFALMPEPFPPPPPIRQPIALIGRSIATRISEHCDHLVGGPDRVRYYEALRCAIELADVVTARAAGFRTGWEHGVHALVGHLEFITEQPISFE